MNQFCKLMVAILSGAVFSQSTAAQDAPDAYGQVAQELFEFEQGRWTSRWDWLDENGEVANTAEGVENFTWSLDKSVVNLVTELATNAQKSVALRFYNPAEKKIVFMSVDQKGDYWLMKQDPLTEEILSEPHAMPDGGEMIIRFTTLRKTENEIDIMMEYTRDDGESWTKGFYQYMKRADA